MSPNFKKKSRRMHVNSNFTRKVRFRFTAKRGDKHVAESRHMNTGMYLASELSAELLLTSERPAEPTETSNFLVYLHNGLRIFSTGSKNWLHSKLHAILEALGDLFLFFSVSLLLPFFCYCPSFVFLFLAPTCFSLFLPSPFPRASTEKKIDGIIWNLNKCFKGDDGTKCFIKPNFKIMNQFHVFSTSMVHGE